MDIHFSKLLGLWAASDQITRVKYASLVPAGFSGEGLSEWRAAGLLAR